MFDKIVNPETNRKVNTHSTLGRKIINNYASLLVSRKQRGGGGDYEIEIFEEFVKKYGKDFSFDLNDDEEIFEKFCELLASMEFDIDITDDPNKLNKLMEELYKNRDKFIR